MKGDGKDRHSEHCRRRWHCQLQEHQLDVPSLTRSFSCRVFLVTMSLPSKKAFSISLSLNCRFTLEPIWATSRFGRSTFSAAAKWALRRQLTSSSSRPVVSVGEEKRSEGDIGDIGSLASHSVAGLWCGTVLCSRAQQGKADQNGFW